MLADQGMQVDAVDPGDLDERLRRNRLVTHYRRRIQDYNPGTKRFNAIVNDMKMDARESIEIMLNYSRHLLPGGVAVITLKMPKTGDSASDAKKILDMLSDDLKRLSSGYSIIGARQLYHNRSEVTVVMNPKRN